ncbi:hypothetical protein CLA01_27680 [Chryseobacterium lathyri]|jgi:hypothetical protein|uniref:Uncharacterized protein n=2 Tax=Chryseobacterium lathyri TaxID=395933 RepID=A0A511YBX0_9FLAO|nr:recombinase family protein [Chryseobacterium lathyri]GEN72696.1 hypothetical protein CLA01_27680 [Chryseobacterium lathyri]
MNFKHIHIGTLINKAVTESGIEISRICNFFKCTEKEIEEMYQQKSMDTELLLKWSKLLEYDFFRLFCQHLILYAPPSAIQKTEHSLNNKKPTLPQFRKNIYTKELIDFILELINTGVKTKLQIMEDYRIPKTTLYKWINKYKK